MPMDEAQPPSRAPQARPGQRGGKRQQNRVQRIQDLGRAGLALFLERGIEGATVDAIVERAGVSKGSFHRYFRDKEHLVHTLFEPVDAAFVTATDRCDVALRAARTDAALDAAYQRLASDLIPVLFSQPDVLRLYLQESRGPAVGARRPVTALAATVATRSIALTRAARNHAQLRSLPPAITALVVVGAAERLLFAALSGDPIGDPALIGRTLISLVLDGVRIRDQSAS